MSRRNHVPMPIKEYTLKDALRPCGHREDYSCKYEHRLEEFASRAECKACHNAKISKIRAEEDRLTGLTIGYLKEHGIETEGANIDPQASNGQVCVTLWLNFPSK